MKLVFLGTPDNAVPSLRAVLDAGHDVRLVVSQPDRPAGRSGVPIPPPVKRLAAGHGLEVIQPAKVRRPAFAEALAAAEPDLLVVVAYGRILTRRVLDVAPLGAVNVHFSLLPSYRGAAPVQWALAHGDTVTGVTTMQISEGLDEGDVLLRREVAVEPHEHAPALGRRLASIGAALLLETIAALAEGRLTPEPQDHERATFAPLLRREDGELDPDFTAAKIEGRVRGFDPWPGAWIRVERAARGRPRRVRLLDARAIGGYPVTDPPGSVLELRDDALIVACGEGTRLAVRRLQAEGRRAVDASDAVNGRLLAPGDRLVAGPE